MSWVFEVIWGLRRVFSFQFSVFSQEFYAAFLELNNEHGTLQSLKTFSIAVRLD